jgi:hypothetical protein
MGVSPVDFQIAIPKASEVAREREIEQTKNTAAQQNLVSSTQHKVEKDVSNVHSKDKAEDSKIKDKQKENPDDTNKNKKKKNRYQYSSEGKTTKDEEENETEGHKIDIKI